MFCLVHLSESAHKIIILRENYLFKYLIIELVPNK